MQGNTEKEMTREYAAISLRFSILAALVSEYLGNTFITDYVRQMAWDLDEELFDMICRAALELGMPLEALASAIQIGKQCAGDDALIDRGMEMQREVDQLRRKFQ